MAHQHLAAQIYSPCWHRRFACIPCIVEFRVEINKLRSREVIGYVREDAEAGMKLLNWAVEVMVGVVLNDVDAWPRGCWWCMGEKAEAAIMTSTKLN